MSLFFRKNAPLIYLQTVGLRLTDDLVSGASAIQISTLTYEVLISYIR